MEYLITAVISAIFLIIYALNKTKDRERFISKLSDEQYNDKIKKITEDMTLPKRGCEKDYNVKKIRRTITLAYFIAKLQQARKRGKHLNGYIELMADNKAILIAICKKDYTRLADLPSVDNQAKVEILSRIILESNGYLLINDKINTCFKLFNSKNTISFDEICSFDLAMYYVFLEKLYYLSKRAISIVRIENYAFRVAKHHKQYSENKLYKEVSKNNLFLHFVSSARREDCADASLVFFDVIQNLTYMTSVIFDGVKFVESSDFVKFYTPLEIFENYEAFVESDKTTKKSFLKEFSMQATKLNLDEYAYAYALKKYSDRAESRYISSIHLDFGCAPKRILSVKHDEKSLRIALTSTFAMNLIFGVGIKNRFLKNGVFKNAFAPQQQISTIKLGVSLKDGKLFLSPNLPHSVSKVSIDLSENNVGHRIVIEKSNTKELYCNGTKYDGISVIKLGDTPLNIHIKTPCNTNRD